jgi:hypothetical protein
LLLVLRSISGLALAAALLWFLWSRFDVYDSATRRIVALAWLTRVVLAQALFWIAYLRLPILRSYQYAHGLWFFATDGVWYMLRASELAAGGLVQLLVGDTQIRYLYASAYVRALAALVWLLGDSVMVGIFLNLLAYLGCALILVRWTSNRLPLIALSFAPTSILWSLQPLKDTLFNFLVLLFFFSLARYFVTHRWHQAITVLILVWAMGSIRWHMGFLLACSTLLPLAIDAFRPRFRPSNVLAAAAMAITLLGAAVLGADGQDPPMFHSLVKVSPVLIDPAARARDAAMALEETRGRYDVSGGGTTIRAGRLLSWSPELSNRHSNLSPGIVASRMLTGLAVIFVPHAIANPLGLTAISGGRGLWWFADAETLVFDAVSILAIIAAISVVRARRLREPAMWSVAVTVVVLTLVLAYDVTNFGTLFREREMVFVGLLVMIILGERKEVAGRECSRVGQSLAPYNVPS